MNYVTPLIAVQEISYAYLVKTQSTGSDITLIPGCQDPGSCSENLGFVCEGGIINEWEAHFEVTGAACSQHPLDALGCQVLVNGTPLQGCFLDNCSSSECPAGAAFYSVSCPSGTSGNPDCTQISATVSVSCGGAPVTCQDDSV